MNTQILTSSRFPIAVVTVDGNSTDVYELHERISASDFTIFLMNLQNYFTALYVSTAGIPDMQVININPETIVINEELVGVSFANGDAIMIGRYLNLMGCDPILDETVLYYVPIRSD